MDLSGSFSLVWQQGDIVIQSIAVLLALMSIASWSIILAKSFYLGRLQGLGKIRNNNDIINRFWEASTLPEGMDILKKLPPFLHLAEQARKAKEHYELFHLTNQEQALDAGMTISELVTRALRQALGRTAIQLERGQIILASVGSTAPFIGLLGTVWGIYHALTVIGESGQASLDTVAGPVGEALIMTAFGLFVAIPAVLAYNAFTRTQRLIMADLDGFAHDLQLFFSLHKD